MRPLSLIGCMLLAACSPAPTSDTLINPANIESDALPVPLTQIAGDIERGRAHFTNRDKGHCILCHQVGGLPDEFQGNIGPALNGVADRLSPAQIRLRLVDYERVKPGTLMPSYHRKAGFHQVQDVYKDKPILTAQEIEDVTAYLSTLTEDE